MSEGSWHVIPLDDLKEHVVSEHCWCEPEVDLDHEDDLIFTHNALDGRDRKPH